MIEVTFRLKKEFEKDLFGDDATEKERLFALEDIENACDLFCL